MTAPAQSQRDEGQRVGVRAYADAEAAERDLPALFSGGEHPPEYRAGVSAGYAWALGRDARAPVTGAGAKGVPDMELLTAEIDAAVVREDEAAADPVTRDYVRGAHAALAWLCGFSDRRV
ncbi:hypothetical protein [Streptomyces peucetius]|uniref:Uncharacterized protein n=1 Tax=Streptomyces peucetius TaxID=1950 RepID=A0ABY6IGD6_STRPE|nr:hypothetical protein [Streptomyces peucetius]UYQ66048.1 hypothetical protein OGH68_34390 [Streptomyces peucetius]